MEGKVTWRLQKEKSQEYSLLKLYCFNKAPLAMQPVVLPMEQVQSCLQQSRQHCSPLKSFFCMFNNLLCHLNWVNVAKPHSS
jgi:hypothetical protein